MSILTVEINEHIIININDATVKCRTYNPSIYISKYILYVPKNDLVGIENINLYDFSPEHFPRGKSGGYYPPRSHGDLAEIDIYVDSVLGNITSFPHRYKVLSKLNNHIFVYLFGQLFLADCLFHEIGHHKFTSEASIINASDIEASEKYAQNYANCILRSVYPSLPIFYSAFNWFYKTLYKSRIRYAGNQ